jgi:uncharacterized YigZ family protein
MRLLKSAQFDISNIMKTFSDEFYTIIQPVTAQIKIKGSRFIGHAVPVTSSEAADEVITDFNKKFYDATHNCFAYRIGIGQNLVQKYSDAGEPAGTAGPPIYQAIESQEMSNVLVVVTRYFGGTKLGKGGLVRAYREATLATLNNAQITKKYVLVKFEIRFPYDLTGEVMHLMQLAEAKINYTTYDNQVNLEIAVRKSNAQRLKKMLSGIEYKNLVYKEIDE